MYKDLIRLFPDYPQKGINFVDWMPVMGNPEAYNRLIDDMVDLVKDLKIDKIAGLESRGYFLGVPIAQRLKVGVVPIRKRGKLPGECLSQDYILEYAKAAIEIQADAVKPGEHILVVDDLLATGGTMEAANKLLSNITTNINDVFFIELTDLNGKETLSRPSRSLLKMKEK